MHGFGEPTELQLGLSTKGKFGHWDPKTQHSALGRSNPSHSLFCNSLVLDARNEGRYFFIENWRPSPATILQFKPRRLFMGVEVIEIEYRDFRLSGSRENGECPFVYGKDVHLTMSVLRVNLCLEGCGRKGCGRGRRRNGLESWRASFRRTGRPS